MCTKTKMEERKVSEIHIGESLPRLHSITYSISEPHSVKTEKTQFLKAVLLKGKWENRWG